MELGIGTVTHGFKTVAHRYGNNLKDLENALAAKGVDAVECDVWFTKRGRFSVHHNKKYWLLPLIGFERWKGQIRFVFMLKDLWLEEVLRKAAGRKILVLDIKGTYHAAEWRVLFQKLFQLLIEFDRIDSVVLDLQNANVHLLPIENISELFGALPPPIRFSIGTEMELQRFLVLDKKITEQLSGISVKKNFLLGPRRLKLLERSVPISVYTVDDYCEALSFLEMGASGIISDKLELLSKLHAKN